MRYLKRIIFINSAHIKYAEINLDGNVHFTGTQGVGKSTLLRAILFFYNADTQGLGIPRQKESYGDYYFKNANSFIIYEVSRDDGTFCVVSYKSQQKVCFRFFDAPYNKDYFVSSNGHVPDSWEPIARQLDQNKVFYSKRKIEEYKEYRDIIYGNHDDKKREFRRYALLESKDYQYLPKTIQNVFLNSKMEAEFIKQTIIMSLGNDLKIDLSLHAHNLENFETQIEDIRKFKHYINRKLATNIADLYIQVKHLQKEKIEIAKQLASANDYNDKQEPLIKTLLDKKNLEKDQLTEKLTKVTTSYKSKKTDLENQLVVLDDYLTRAREAKSRYEKINIQAIIERVAKNGQLTKEQGHLKEEKNLLTSAFAEINHRYTSMTNQLINQHVDLSNSRNSEINLIKEEYLELKEQIFKNYNKIIQDVRTDNKKAIDDARKEVDDRRSAIQDLKVSKERIRHHPFFETEISVQNDILRNCEKEINRLNAENEKNRHEIETFEKQWNNELLHLNKTNAIDLESLQKKITDLHARTKEIDYYLENSKDSLYGWLNKNYANWENTIGKVIDEKNVLFESSLNPEMIGESDSFYGIRINLEQISKKVKTVKDYEEEKENLTLCIEEHKKEFVQIQSAFEKDKGNLKIRFQTKITEKKTSIRENDYNLQQIGAKLNDAKSKLLKLRQSATEEKNKKLEEIESNLANAINAEIEAKAKLVKIEDELAKLIATKEKERDKKIQAEQERTDKLKAAIIQLIEDDKITLEKRKIELKELLEDELAGKGADTKRLGIINERLSVIEIELAFIEENRDSVSEYRKDKRELLDKVDEFKAEKEKLINQLTLETQKYNKKSSELKGFIENVQQEINSFEKKWNEIKEDRELFTSFAITDLYKSLPLEVGSLPTQDITNKGGTSVIFEINKRVKHLIEDIKEIHYDRINSSMENLKKQVIELTGKFSDKNILKFRKQFTDNTSYLEFAEMLYDFMEENKIDRIEKEVNERFALIITTIGRETTNMISEQAHIQKVVRKINEDFRDREIAVGVIKMIELKVDESKNEIFQLLKKIMQFNDENARELGTQNLFSTEESDKKNKEAVELLKIFSKKINESRKEYILLSDSFDLKFRIEENQNNTGWVEKLSNVGSDGTDVLVKAMVNIMLLNVFKEGASRSFKDFKLHCMMDEIGKLHPTNVRGILKFANQRNILLINGSPIENDALAFTHIYQLQKDSQSTTRVKRLITQMEEVASLR